MAGPGRKYTEGTALPAIDGVFHQVGASKIMPGTHRDVGQVRFSSALTGEAYVPVSGLLAGRPPADCGSSPLESYE